MPKIEDVEKARAEALAKEAADAEFEAWLTDFETKSHDTAHTGYFQTMTGPQTDRYFAALVRQLPLAYKTRDTRTKQSKSHLEKLKKKAGK